ncbi:hypothetical protein VHEMI00281 [[Torrubiella] hemipterigena]|uniref:DUF1479 domain protein n=1 Tax=[Torrubiella] hemipterigena TaxID=1531966 RepID=A0A0A1T1U3_9HYPO|nr:hypothetical protein VHEMI00281 [[Torrubiella] hemipterigena]
MSSSSSSRDDDTARLRKVILDGSTTRIAPPAHVAPSMAAKLMQARQEAKQTSLRRSAPASDHPSPYKVARPRRTEPERTPGTATPPSSDATRALSFWGPDPVPLPSRFARIKKNLIAGHETELEASWTRLLAAIRADVDQIEGLGAHLIPSIEFADLSDPSQTSRFGRDLRRYGVGVIRKVVPKADIEASVQDTIRYIDVQSRRGRAPSVPVRGQADQPSSSVNSPREDADGDRYGHFHAPKHDPACFDLFWTPAQVRTRAHPNIRLAQRFMMSLWETRADDPLAPQHPITYADRIRIYGPGASAPAAKVGDQRSKKGTLPKESVPQSADDWISALQSSAGITAQVDNGSLERWEPDGYQRAGTYSSIFQGRWEEYDPWRSACRVSANMDLYNGYGACTIFRMFQGVVALSSVEPGMIRLLPSPKLATAYYLLRPFFEPTHPAPEWISANHPGYAEAWDAYLSPSNWKLNRNPDPVIHGAVPGHAQRVTERWHPHLMLRSSMITLPTLKPGDYILWHPDLPYHLSSGESMPGVETPQTAAHWFDDARMLVYVPAAPLTQTSALYLARQRKSYQRGHPGPDFDSSGSNNQTESDDIRPDQAEIAAVGGQPALRAMGLALWEEENATLPWFEKGWTATNGDGDDERTYDSPSSATTMSTADTEVLRLANVILFPDKAAIG